MKKLLLFILFPTLIYGQVQIGQDIDGQAEGDGFGRNISLSANGTILAIAAQGSNENTGQIRIFENQNNVWLQIGQDINGNTSESLFGTALSLSSDGSIVAIGSVFNNGNGGFVSRVRVYENQSENWIQIGQVINGAVEGPVSSGPEVSLSSNGLILAIGVSRNDEVSEDAGQVRVYEYMDNVWSQVGQNINGQDSEDFFGTRVSITADGTKLAIGAIGNDENSGYTSIYENLSGNWIQVGENINGEEFGDRSGAGLQISADGSIVAIGANRNDGNGEDSGHVRVFEESNGVWAQIGQDLDSEEIGDRSGVGLSMTADGSIVAIGATRNDGNGEDSGHARIFKNQEGNWIQIGQDIDGEEENDQFGVSISLSNSGDTMSIGAIFNDGNGMSAGHVRVFDLSALLSLEEFTVFDFSLYPNPASNQITIETENNIKIKKITIYNSLGQFITSSRQTSINTSKLSQGIYIIEVFTDRGISSKKLIIE